ncbi:hypothetical protein CCACVL1_18971 [Corchorus capsularis]|uniref:Uncharacterized protein n=1 Tax=Corchorus capsularis TaxID=210143 RepID=A0A1R3HJ98_COCAP|nr:hypothetical protein CCACVL1_18971 [Corchorus capsularis]
MVRNVRIMQNWGEITPDLMISRQKPSPSSSPRLETIAEEECCINEGVPKRVFVLLPKKKEGI